MSEEKAIFIEGPLQISIDKLTAEDSKLIFSISMKVFILNIIYNINIHIDCATTHLRDKYTEIIRFSRFTKISLKAKIF